MAEEGASVAQIWEVRPPSTVQNRQEHVELHPDPETVQLLLRIDWL